MKPTVMVISSMSTASINVPEDLLVLKAERELSAFFRAITKLYGLEEARRASEDWLQQLEMLQSLSNTPRQFRLLTINASLKLAKRVCSNGSESSANTGAQRHLKRTEPSMSTPAKRGKMSVHIRLSR